MLLSYFIYKRLLLLIAKDLTEASIRSDYTFEFFVMFKP